MKKVSFIFLLLLLPALLFAENFYISSYNVNIDISKSNVYTISEELVLDFTTPSHGLYFNIPITSQVRRKPLVDIISVSDNYSTSKNSDYLSLKIGDKDKLITGEKSYKIVYTYDLGADNYDSYDEFYYNIIGTSWQTDLYNISFKVTFPESIKDSFISLTSGSYGSTSQNNLAYSLSSDGRTITGFSSHLRSGEGITLRTELKEGYFVGARVVKDFSITSLLLIFALLVVFILIFIMLYKKYGVDDKLVIYPRFTPPEGLSPLDVGYLFDSAADNKDFTSMIFFWADKGYLTIEEKKKDNFVLHKKSEIVSDKAYEVALFNALFNKGDEVSVKDVSSSFLTTIEQVVKPQLYKRFSSGEENVNDNRAEWTSRFALILSFVFAVASSVLISLNDISFAIFSLFVALINGVIIRLLLWIITKKYYAKRKPFLIFISIVIAFVILINTVLLSLISLASGMKLPYLVISALLITLGTLALSLVAIFIRKRSHYGQSTLESLLGYRDFIERAEIDEIKRLSKEDPDFYYHTLSYAIVFGLEKEWSKAFDNLYVQDASWYIGTRSTSDLIFYAILFSRFNNNYMAKINTPLVQTNYKGGTSSFSGFSGFSGGGFGGSGGSSW